MDWLSTIIGALIGYLLPYLFKFIRYCFLRFRKNRIIGNWYIYERTVKENKKLKTSGYCSITFGILSRFKIKMTNNNLVYIGTANVEDNHLYMTVTNKNDNQIRKETCFQRYDFSYGDYDKMYGLWVSNNYDGHTCCGVSILSKVQLTEDEVDELLENSYFQFDKSVLSIK